MHDIHKHRPLETFCVERQFKNWAVVQRLGASAQVGNHCLEDMLTVDIAQVDGGTLGIETELVIASATG